MRQPSCRTSQYCPAHGSVELPIMRLNDKDSKSFVPGKNAGRDQGVYQRLWEEVRRNRLVDLLVTEQSPEYLLQRFETVKLIEFVSQLVDEEVTKGWQPNDRRGRRLWLLCGSRRRML